MVDFACNFTTGKTLANRNICTAYCLGNDLPPTSTDWMNRWIDEFAGCLFGINFNLFPSDNSGDVPVPLANVALGEPVPPDLFTDISGFLWAQSLMQSLGQKYRSQGFALATNPGFQGYNDFQNIVFDVCRSAPGLCTETLSNLCGPETTETLLVNREKVPWCGCYMADTEYEEYADRYELPRECTPMCARHDNIGIVGPSQVNALTCTQDSCVIDNVTIELAQVDVSEGIDFAQFCGGCSGSSAVVQGVERLKASSSCQCIISNLTIEAADTQIGGDINLTQDCGNIKCFRTNDSGDQLPSDCNSDENPFDQQQTEEEEARRNAIIRNGIIIAIVIVLLIVLIFLF